MNKYSPLLLVSTEKKHKLIKKYRLELKLIEKEIEKQIEVELQEELEEFLIQQI